MSHARDAFYPSSPNGGCAPLMVEFDINLRSCTLKSFGVFILIAGICWMIFALNMDVSVTTGISKVYNLGLMADR